METPSKETQPRQDTAPSQAMLSTMGPAPFLKWPGGKRALLKTLRPLLPEFETMRSYYEPFLGGGAMFFEMAGYHAHLSDANAELIATWRAVRDDVEGVIAALETFKDTTKETYLAVRGYDWTSLRPNEVAARMIFLNHLCFNGLYRVNAKGQFNVAYAGYKNPFIYSQEVLRAVSREIQLSSLYTRDFCEIEPVRNDFVFCDPPYIGGFTSYTAGGFTEANHELLARCAREWTKEGVRVMITNSDTPRTREIYDGFHFTEIEAPRRISCSSKSRGQAKELVIRNYT
jgi:DNA adenine methylase